MTAKTPPWKRRSPKPKAARQKLSPELVELARERARAAGRRYPNLVDNMYVAKLQKKKPPDRE